MFTSLKLKYHLGLLQSLNIMLLDIFNTFNRQSHETESISSCHLNVFILKSYKRSNELYFWAIDNVLCIRLWSLLCLCCLCAFLRKPVLFAKPSTSLCCLFYSRNDYQINHETSVVFYCWSNYGKWQFFIYCNLIKWISNKLCLEP